MWPLVHGQKPLKCQEKPSGVYKMQQTTGAAGVPPRTPLGELTTLETFGNFFLHRCVYLSHPLTSVQNFTYIVPWGTFPLGGR